MPAKPTNIQKIYVELDAFLDTRLGALWQLNPEHCDLIIGHGYHERIIDNFTLINDAIDHESWLPKYQQRDISTLKVSRLTNFVFAFSELVNELELSAISQPDIDGLELVINTHPYVFNIAELEDLKDCIKTYVGTTCGISTIYEPVTNLSLLKIKGNYDAVVLYSFSAWLESLQEDDIKSNPCPAVKMIAPALFKDKLPTKDDLRDFNDSPMGILAENEINLQAIIGVHFWDIAVFSVVIPA